MVLMMVAEQAESTPNAEPMPTGVRRAGGGATAGQPGTGGGDASADSCAACDGAAEQGQRATERPHQTEDGTAAPKAKGTGKIASASSIASSTSAPPSLDGKRVAAPQTSVASQPSQDASVWSGLLLAHLSRFKRYPAWRYANSAGVVQVAVTLDRQGNVLGVKLLRSSGVSSLDREALQLPQRASPLPAPGNEIAAGQAEFSVNIPIRFDLREVRR